MSRASYVGIAPNGMVYAHSKPTGWNKFTLESGGDGKLRLRCSTGYLLCMTVGGKVYGSEDQDGNEVWKWSGHLE